MNPRSLPCKREKSIPPHCGAQIGSPAKAEKIPPCEESGRIPAGRET